MRIGLQHEHAVELGVLLDFGAVDEEAVALRVGEETAVAFVADEAALSRRPRIADSQGVQRHSRTLQTIDFAVCGP